MCPNGTCYKCGGVVCHAINLDERRVTIVQIGFFFFFFWFAVLGLKKSKLKSHGGICVAPSRPCSKLYPILTLKQMKQSCLPPKSARIGLENFWTVFVYFALFSSMRDIPGYS